MYVLNDKGAARVAKLKVLSGIELHPVQGKKTIVHENGDIFRKFKIVNHGQVHFVELELDEYCLKHPAEIQPIALDEKEPIVFETMPNCNRGARYKVDLCRDGGRGFIKVRTLPGVSPHDYSFAINYLIQDLLTNAAQNMRMKVTTFPQISQ